LRLLLDGVSSPIDSVVTLAPFQSPDQERYEEAVAECSRTILRSRCPSGSLELLENVGFGLVVSVATQRLEVSLKY
jgi:hypothetical protein